MTPKKFANLKRGDLVRDKMGATYLVDGACGINGSYMLVRTVIAHVASDWDLVATVRYKEDPETLYATKNL